MTRPATARGEIVLLMDDDDLPLSRDWISAHDAAFRADPDLVGLSCRMVRHRGEPSPWRD